MKNYFVRGNFSQYRKESLNESVIRHDGMQIHDSFDTKTTVFISHKHDDLNEIKDIIGFLELKYDVRCYIDSKDPSMPEVTSKETAERIKQEIRKCDKFILLATEAAIASKWCNWELGYGDAQKLSDDNLAIFAISNVVNVYHGNEYMNIYPHIVQIERGDTYKNGQSIIPGYYICYKNNQGYIITPLEEWLQK